jgi:serine/threonine protein kinase
MYELNFGKVMLYGMGKGDSIIYRTLQIAGWPPLAWQRYWDVDKFLIRRNRNGMFDTECAYSELSLTYFQESALINPESFWSTTKKSAQLVTTKYGQGTESDLEKDTDQFIDLLRKMLKINPEERPLIKDLLQHLWFTTNARMIDEDLPDRIEEKGIAGS